MTPRVLFVDDDELILKTFRALLRRRLNLEIAVGPEEGLRMLEDQGPFDVVVADMNMPVMDGMEFIGRARQSFPQTIYLVLSGTVDLCDQLTPAQKALVYRILEKPCPMPKLLETITAAVDTRERTAQAWPESACSLATPVRS